MAEEQVCEDEIVDALMVSGIKFEDPLAALKNLIYKHCFIKEINIRIYFREQLMEDARKAVADALDKCLRGKHTDWNKIKLVIRDAMKQKLQSTQRNFRMHIISQKMSRAINIISVQNYMDMYSRH